MENYNQNDFEKSICFSAEFVEELNRRAFELDPRLFLFAHYEPKPYRSNESFKNLFTIAVINLYGLFKDCGSGKNLFNLMDSLCDLSENDKKTHNNLYSDVMIFRSMFCHNFAPNNYPLDEAGEKQAKKRLEIEEDVNIMDIPEEKWEYHLQKLCADAYTVQMNFSAGLDSLIQTNNKEKEDQIKKWIDYIVNFYISKPNLLLNAILPMILSSTNGSKSDQAKAEIVEDPEGMYVGTLKWLKKNRFIESPNVAAFKPNKKKPYPGRWLDRSKIKPIIDNWPNEWAIFNEGQDFKNCPEGPHPESDFFKILAKNLSEYMNPINPNINY